MLPSERAAFPSLGDLTLPQPGSTTTRRLLSAAVQQAIGVVRAIGARATSDAATTFRRQVAPSLLAEPGLLAASTLLPSRLTLARSLALADAPARDRIAWEAELATLLAIDAASAGIISGTISVVGGPARVIAERQRIAYEAPEAREWRLDDEGIEAVTTTARAKAPWRASAAEANKIFARVGGTARPSSVPVVWEASLLLVDNNPLSGVEAHPDKEGNAIDLGGHDESEWRREIGAALAVIDEHLPEISAEMKLALRHLAPVGYDAEKHLSASYLEAIGVVYLTLHPHRMTLVEALVHEFQHNKLNLALGFDPLLRNGDSPLFASPVRPDPRPLRGVLLAVHAFQPIAVLYERLVAKGGRPDAAWLEKRLREIARTCREGCDVLLPNAQPTEWGKTLLDETRALDARLAMHLE